MNVHGSTYHGLITEGRQQGPSLLLLDRWEDLRMRIVYGKSA